MLETAAKHDALIASNNLLGTVSVVNIKIDYGNAL